jgi:UDPglucose 6-dehydrogenase
VRLGIGMDPRIGPQFLYAGMGYGGSCFPKDVKALIKTASLNDQQLHLLTATEKVNEAQKDVLFRKVVRFFGSPEALAGKTIALWGLAFKPNTDDMREAPSRNLIKALFAAGANVVAYDPVAAAEARRVLTLDHGDAVIDAQLRIVDSARAAVEGADVLVLVTEWKEFRAPDLAFLAEKLKQKAVFDGRNIYDPEAFAAAGLSYEGIGRRSRRAA